MELNPKFQPFLDAGETLYFAVTQSSLASQSHIIKRPLTSYNHTVSPLPTRALDVYQEQNTDVIHMEHVKLSGGLWNRKKYYVIQAGVS